MGEPQQHSHAAVSTLKKHIGPQISVVIPARNEANNLYYILPNMPSFVSEVILVDGYSSDSAIVVARKLHPSIRISEQAGQGKGDALRVGFAVCTGDIIVEKRAAK